MQDEALLFAEGCSLVAQTAIFYLEKGLVK